MAFRWPVIGLLAAGTTVLGILGFLEQASEVGEDRAVIEAAYRTIQLFVLEWGGLEQPMPLALEVARFSAPLVAGLAAAKALVIIFRVEAERMWVRLFGRNHVVVCGQGSSGWRLAEALRQGKWRVAAIDPGEPEQPVTHWAFIQGDATDPETLERAAVHRARHLVAITGDDATNIAIARAARDLGTDQLHIHVLTTQPELAALLRSEALRTHSDPAPVLEFFTLEERGARVLVDSIDDRPNLIAASGSSRLADRVVSDCRRRWADIEVIRELVDPTRLLGQRSVVLVSDTSREDGLTTALGLVHRLKQHSFGAGGGTTDVFILSPKARYLSGLIATAHGVDAAIRIHPFDLGEVVLTPALLEGGARESIARALHEAYRRTAATGTASMPPWEDLDDDARHASREAADGIGALFREVGCDLVAAAPNGDEPLRLLPSEVELMAMLEHDRWLAWSADRPGAAEHPHRRDWFDLPGDIRERNQAVIRCLPSALHDVGQRVVRLERSPARRLHAAYVERRTALGETPETNSSLVPWDRLPESLQDSNRDQLAHLRVKLRSIGLDLEPGDGSLVTLTPEQVERLSVMEHDRWVRHRRFDGWTSGAEKDTNRKVTPHLVAWEDLDETTRETDREFVRGIPTVAATLGKHITGR